MTSIMLNKGAHGFQWKLIKRPWIFDGFGSAPIKQLSRLTSAPCCNSSYRPRRPNPPCANAPANFRSYRSAPAARGGGVPADHSQRRLQAQPPLPSGSATPSNTSTRGSPSRTCSEDPAPRGTPSPTNTSIVDSSHTRSEGAAPQGTPILDARRRHSHHRNRRLRRPLCSTRETYRQCRRWAGLPQWQWPAHQYLLGWVRTS